MVAPMASEVIDLTHDSDSDNLFDNLKQVALRAERAAAEVKINGDHVKERLTKSSTSNPLLQSSRTERPDVQISQHLKASASGSDTLTPKSLHSSWPARSDRDVDLSALSLSSPKESTLGQGSTSKKASSSQAQSLSSNSSKSHAPISRATKLDVARALAWSKGEPYTLYSKSRAPLPSLDHELAKRSSRPSAFDTLPTAVSPPERRHDEVRSVANDRDSKHVETHDRKPPTSLASVTKNAVTGEYDASKLCEFWPAAEPCEAKEDEISRTNGTTTSLGKSGQGTQTLSSATSFPEGFDRGRFPKERRRRGGKKYGTSRINGFPKTPAPTVEWNSRLSQMQSKDDDVEESSEFRTPVVSGLNRISIDKKEIHSQANARRIADHGVTSTSMIDSMSFGPSNHTSPDKLLWSDWEREQVFLFFISVTAPTIRKLSALHKHQLEERETITIDRSIANDAIDDELLRVLRNDQFLVSQASRKRIRQYFSRKYSQRLAAILETRNRERSLEFSNEKVPWHTLFHGSQNSESPRVENQRPPVRSDKGRQKSSAQGFKEVTANHSFADGNPPPTLASVQPPIISPSKSEQVHSSTTKTKERLVRGSKFGIRKDENMILEPHQGPAVEDLQGAVALRLSRRLNGPSRFQDPYLEDLVAQAALGDAQVDSRDCSPPFFLTPLDREKALDQPYVLKSIRRTRQEKRDVISVIQAKVVDPVATPQRRIPALLRHREFGPDRPPHLQATLRSRVLEQLQTWRSWKGASSDIVSVAWNPNSSTYAVGAAAHTNPEDLQYNRPCNLLLGHLSPNELVELPCHRTKRPTPNEIIGGPNSSQETYNTCDPMIYQTINSVQFSRDGRHLYTASRDHTVKVWDVSKREETCVQTLNHNSVVTSVDVCRSNGSRLFASASQSISDSIQVFNHDSYHAQLVHSFSSTRAEAKPHLRILPECLRWGSSAGDQHYLLCGFTQWDHLGRYDLAREGHLCLWDVAHEEMIKVTPGSQSVTSVAWHPTFPYFISGGAPSGNLSAAKHGVRSVVRTYDRRSLTRCTVEFETKVLDIQDVTYHPINSNIVTAGCTDGKVLVWDYRWPGEQLHCLSHDLPLMELDQDRSRAEADTGVRMSLWNSDGSLFYSGSSDGMIKAWDVRRHPQDVLVRNVAQIGAAVQDGAFSPDFSHLLVGDADGGVHILSAAPTSSAALSDGEGAHEAERITLIRAPDGSGRRLDTGDDNPGTEGIEIARKLIASSQLDIDPVFGPGKGRYYTGPFAKDSQRKGDDKTAVGNFDTETSGKQVYFEDGRLNTNIASMRKLFSKGRSSHLNEQKTFDLASRSSGTDGVPAKAGPLGDATWKKTKQVTSKADQGSSKKQRSDVLSEETMMKDDFWWPRLGEKQINTALSR